jgi:hypothetical protein
MMDWNYFIVDGIFKIRKLPKPKKTVKIEDITDIDSDYRTELKRYGKDIEGAKKNYLDYYKDILMVEVEPFDEYFDRNKKRFLKELNGLKGKYGFIEELYYWTDDTYNDIKRNIESWDRFDCYDENFCPDEKTLIKMEKLDIIERKKSSEKTDLYEYIKSNATVSELNNIAINNNITVRGKKAEKINQLIEALENGLIIHTEINMYRPGKNFQSWFNQLQINYIDEIEYALSTFDYPEFYIMEVWREAVLVNNEFPLIETTIKERQKRFFDIIAQDKERLKNTNIQKQSTNELKIGGIDITITTSIDTGDDKFKKKASSPKKTDNYYLNEVRKKKAKEKKKIKEKEKKTQEYLAFVGIIIILVILNFIFK